MSIAKETDDVKRRMEAEAQLEAFLSLLETRYGLEPKDIPDLLDTLRRLHKRRIDTYNLQWNVLLGILMLAVSGLGHSLWTGLKEMLK